MVDKKILNIVFTPESAFFFFVLRPIILPQPGLGKIAEQVQVLVE
jgi:hypothetical protein